MIAELGRYKILKELGQGAMGTVYMAVDPMIDRTVAIKTIKLDLSAAEMIEYQGRFEQEVKATGRLTHPNIVTVFDVGRTEKMAYMAMEFLHGHELKDIISSGKLMPIPNTVDVMAQVCDGLAFAHENAVIHRDIKPSNIMVLPSGLAKITDFGIARTPDAAVKTMTGMILGSPRYMSPEQVIGKELDPRTDIFSAGVVLYEALTGVAPFDGDNVNAIMYATVNTNPVPASQRNREVPRMLDLIVAKALAKDIDDRYVSADQMAADLRSVLRQQLAESGQGLVPLPPRAPLHTLPTHASLQAAPPAAAAQDATVPSMQAMQAMGRTVPPSSDGVTPDGRYQAVSTTGLKPLKLAAGFDSFDATLKLAAKTNQTDEFRDYITATQKMRAWKDLRVNTTGQGSAFSPAAEAQKQRVAQQVSPNPAGPSGTHSLPAFNPAAHTPRAVPVSVARPSKTLSNAQSTQTAATTLAWVAVALAILIAVALLATFVF